MKNFLGYGALVIAVGAIGFGVAMVEEALGAQQTKTITYDDATIVNSHGSYKRLPDAGFAVECCGAVKKIDGGVVRDLESPCVSAEAGGIAATFTSCLSTWRSVNGY